MNINCWVKLKKLSVFLLNVSIKRKVANLLSLFRNWTLLKMRNWFAIEEYLSTNWQQWCIPEASKILYAGTGEVLKSQINSLHEQHKRVLCHVCVYILQKWYTSQYILVKDSPLYKLLIYSSFLFYSYLANSLPLDKYAFLFFFIPLYPQICHACLWGI